MTRPTRQPEAGLYWRVRYGVAPRERRELRVLVAAFPAVAAWSAIRPYHMADYLPDLAAPLGGLVLLVATTRWYRLTPLACRLLFLEGLILLVGAHDTHEGVPLFDRLKAPMGWERNHDDRVAHGQSDALAGTELT